MAARVEFLHHEFQIYLKFFLLASDLLPQSFDRLESRVQLKNLSLQFPTTDWRGFSLASFCAHDEILRGPFVHAKKAVQVTCNTDLCSHSHLTPRRRNRRK